MESYYLIILALAIVFLILVYAILKLFEVKITKTSFTTKQITGAAVLATVELIMIVVSNYTAIGPVNMNLSLVPIAVGALLYGPAVGAFLGFLNGMVTIVSPSTLGFFMTISPLGTVLVCLIKTTAAGLVAGFVFRAFKKKRFVGALISSLLVPIINTSIFIGGSYLFFQSWLNAGAQGYDGNTFMFLLIAVVGWNFLIELGIEILLSPSVYSVVSYFSRKRD